MSTPSSNGGQRNNQGASRPGAQTIRPERRPRRYHLRGRSVFFGLAFQVLIGLHKRALESELERDRIEVDDAILQRAAPGDTSKDAITIDHAPAAVSVSVGAQLVGDFKHKRGTIELLEHVCGNADSRLAFAHEVGDKLADERSKLRRFALEFRDERFAKRFTG